MLRGALLGGYLQRLSFAPPLVQIEELDIEPQLLEKYLARKEQSRGRDQPGEQRLVNKSTAMLIFIGLLSGLHQWVQEKTRKLIPIWATLLATFLTTWGVGSVCLFLLNRSM